MITLFERRCAQSRPCVLAVDSARHLQSNRQITALDSQVKSSLLVLDEMQSDLWISLLLQISDNALTDQVRRANDLQDLVIVFADESELEAILGGVDGDSPWLSGAVEAVNNLALDSSEIHGLIKRLDDAVVSGRSARSDDGNHCLPRWQSVFDMIESSIYQNPAVVPCSGFDSNRLMDERTLAERLVCDRNG